jgi:hypothetical protein
MPMNRAVAKMRAAKMKQRQARLRAWLDEASAHNCADHAVRCEDGCGFECDECGAELKPARLAL